MRRSIFFFVSFLFISNLNAQTDSLFKSSIITMGELQGTLTLPNHAHKNLSLVILIAGSGPTDRDGNNPMMKNNSLKMLAESLSSNGIAVFRYDKRGIGASVGSGLKEESLRFETYIQDAEQWVDHFKATKSYGKIIIAGHSEGSLIGMAASRSIDAFISIAGAGDAADVILKRQLQAQPQQVRDLCFPMIDSLKAGKLIPNVPPMLQSLFRASVQPYMISWFKYDPQVLIAKMNMPILLLQGTKDIQVLQEDAQHLNEHCKSCTLTMVEDMNHILKIVKESDRASNIKTYSDPSLPISDTLVRSIISFVQKNR